MTNVRNFENVTHEIRDKYCKCRIIDQRKELIKIDGIYFHFEKPTIYYKTIFPDLIWPPLRLCLPEDYVRNL